MALSLIEILSVVVLVDALALSLPKWISALQRKVYSYSLSIHSNFGLCENGWLTRKKSCMLILSCVHFLQIFVAIPIRAVIIIIRK